MLNFKTVIIQRVIVHLLDNHKNKIELSQREIDLDLDIKNWLTSHIMNAIKEERIRAANFDPAIAGNLAEQKTEELFNDERKFVECSQSFAKHLFHFMKGDKRISPGDFVMVLFFEQEDGIFHLAILKMDPQPVVTHKIEDRNGIKYIRLIPRGEGLPNPRQRLQKAAIFLNPKKGAKYEMMVLDNQIALLEKEGRIANFFAGQFLGCRLSLTARDRTIDIYKHTKKFIENTFPPKKAFKLSTNLNDIMKGARHLSIKQFSKQLFAEPAAQNNYLSYLEEAEFVDREFNLDREWVEKHLRKREIKTREGIRIVGTAASFKEHVQLKQKVRNKTDIIIKDVTYSEK